MPGVTADKAVQAALLVVGPGPVAGDDLARAAGEIGKRVPSESRLDVLLFQEGPAETVVGQVRAIWQGEVRQLGGARYLAQVDYEVRDSISEFVADVRERLVSIALSTGGPGWAERFGSLWWKTGISEKNSPADRSWWQLFRAAALRLCLREQTYSVCVAMGDTDFVPVMRQVAVQADLRFAAVERQGEIFRWRRVLAIRAVGCVFFVVAILAAKWHHRRTSGAARNRHGGSGPPLLFSWYPRIWTDRLGGWKDMYHGGLVRRLAESLDEEPVLALRIFDRTKFVTPAVYLDRIRLLSTPGRAPGRYVVLESFGRFFEVLRSYVSPRDVLRFRRMTRHTGFDRALTWDGIELTELLKPGLWRSVLVNWPHLLALQGAAMRAVRHVRPSVAIVYCFEFVYGRALIEGTRRGGPGVPIVGLQHGPISPMQLLYAGSKAERVLSPSGGVPMPEPDLYAMDGSQAVELMHERGIPLDRLEITGAARFDDVWTEARRLLDVQENRKRPRTRILIASGLHDTPFVLGMVLRALGDDPRLELVLKPHPKLSGRALTELVGDREGGDEGRGARLTVVREGSIYEWMTRSAILLGTYSSSSVEALAFQIPVVLLLPNHTPDMSLYNGRPAPVLKAATTEELRESVNMLVGEAGYASSYLSRIAGVLEDSFGPIDSKSSERLANLCVRMVAERGGDRLTRAS